MQRSNKLFTKVMPLSVDGAEEKERNPDATPGVFKNWQQYVFTSRPTGSDFEFAKMLKTKMWSHNLKKKKKENKSNTKLGQWSLR